MFKMKTIFVFLLLCGMSFSCRIKVDEEREPILSKHVSISLQSSFFKWPRAGLFFFIFVFSVDSKQMCNMAGFEPRTSGYGSVFTSDYFNLFFFDLLPPHFFTSYNYVLLILVIVTL